MIKDNILLSRLDLQNFATFERQSIKFEKGLNIIVGETGSGKSLIFDALQIILGQRADKSLVRTNTEFASIEASFKTNGNHVNIFLDTIGYPGSDEEIILKRIIYKNGKTKSFINFQQCNLNTLQSFSKKYIDLVGQFENQKLLSPRYQLKLLDTYSKNESLLKSYSECYENYKNLVIDRNQLTQKQNDREQRQDYLNFQINEIESINPLSGEEEELILKKDTLLKKQSSGELFEKLRTLYFDSENSLSSQIGKIGKILANAPHLIPDESYNSFLQATSLLEDFSFHLSNNDDSAEEDELEKILERLDKFQKIKRKFSNSIDGVIDQLNIFRNEIEDLDNMSLKLDSLNKIIKDQLSKLKILSENLSKSRNTNSSSLAKKLSLEIQALNMKGASIKIELNKIEDFEKYGQDHISILAETNPGEGFFSIEKIASGGELSRILLSIRKLLVSDSISIFLFDEVDTGMGGETALLIGKSLKSVAKKSQVIAISHLPQIAINADRIIKVEKNTFKIEKDLRTISNIDIIDSKIKIKKESELMTPLN